MSGENDDDLRDAFGGLHAPRSTSEYAFRTPVAHPTPAGAMRRWSPVTAAAVAVAIALGGAITFVAVRNARQAPSAAGAGDTPPPRSYAAMAYDSVAALTVMFGGSGPGGARLADTWTWDGSRWSRLSGVSPPAMTQPEMADDPLDGGVILVGDVAAGGGAVACSREGSAASGAGHPAVGPLPAISAVPEPGIATGPPIVCPVAPAPTTQTWILDTRGWHEVASGTSVPPGGAPLARVPGSGQVVAVATSGVPVLCVSSVPCGSPNAPPVAAPGMCELTMSGGCGAYSAPVRTWLWSAGRWSSAPTLDAAGSTLELVPTVDGNSLELLSPRVTLGYFCNNLAGGCPQALPSGTSTWRWAGQEWRPDLSGLNLPPSAGGALAASGGRALLLTTTGETWLGPSGGWTEVAAPPGLYGRAGEALGGDRDGGFVMFGGQAGAAGAPGSDTWVFESGGWRRVGGVAPASPAPVDVCPATGAPTTPCVTEILPQRPAATAPNPCFQQDCRP